MSGYIIQVPSITSASVTPNPAQQSGTLTIAVTITEASVALEPYYYMSGDLYAGEV